MLFKQMKYFVSIVDCNSFTDAADKCFISQSAISQQMQALESELGVKLFTRVGRKFALTPAGEYFYGRCRAVLNNVDEILRETVRLGSDTELHLRIGYLASYDGAELQCALIKFAEIYPDVVIDVFKCTHEDLYHALKNNETDIALNDQRRAFSDEYENYILNQSPAYVDIAPAHNLAQLPVVTVRELDGLSCILVAPKNRESTEREFYENTLGVGKQFIFADSLDEARLLAMSGRGYFLPESVKKSAQSPLVRKELRRADGTPIVRTYCAFWKKSKSNYYIEEFAKLLRDEFAE